MAGEYREGMVSDVNFTTMSLREKAEVMEAELKARHCCEGLVLPVGRPTAAGDSASERVPRLLERQL